LDGGISIPKSIEIAKGRLDKLELQKNKWGTIATAPIAGIGLTSTGHHDTVRNFQDFVIVFKTLLILDFANDFNVLTSIIGQELSKVLDIGCLSDKTSGNEINIVLDSKIDDIIHILFRKGGKVHDDTGKVHVLALSNGSIVFNAAETFTGRFVTGQDGQD
jgi:hypothetical protein